MPCSPWVYSLISIKTVLSGGPTTMSLPPALSLATMKR